MLLPPAILILEKAGPEGLAEQPAKLAVGLLLHSADRTAEEATETLQQKAVVMEQSASSGPEMFGNSHPHEQQTNKEQNGIRATQRSTD